MDKVIRDITLRYVPPATIALLTGTGSGTDVSVSQA
jgi:hypothetical protein